MAPAGHPPQAVDVGTRKQLFLDDRVAAQVENGAPVWNTPVQCAGNPALRGERLWEKRVACPIGGPAALFDDEEKVFKTFQFL